MKKLMLIAALGAAALFTACGDDDSSSAKAAGTYSCDVKVDEKAQSVTTEWNIEGKKTQDVYTIVGDSLKIERPDTTTVRPLIEGEDLKFLEEFAKKGCEETIKLYDEAKNEAK